MKGKLLTIALAVLTIGFLGSCSKINNRIDDLDKRVEGIEQEKIASIQNQIAGINQSIADLGTIRNDILNLQVAVGAKGEDISALQAADVALGKRIDELKTYVGDLSKYAEKDWATATFATLEQLGATNKTLSALEELIAELGEAGEASDAKIAELDEKLSKSIKSAVSRLNSSISSLEGRVSALEQMIQTVTIIPAYSDGSVEADEDGKLTINCIISPASAVASLTEENFTVLLNEVNTKAETYETLEADTFEITNNDTGEVKITADISGYTVTVGKALMTAVKVKDENSEYVTDFVPVTRKGTIVLAASSVQDANDFIAQSDDYQSKKIDLSSATIQQSDVAPDNTIHFVLKTTSPVDLVSFELPAIPDGINCDGWTIEYEENYPTQNVDVNAPNGTKVTILAPTSHVTVTGTNYAEIIALTGDNTLVIPEGVTVDKLIAKKGAFEIHGTVSELVISPEGDYKVCFRDCEGLSQSVFDAIKGNSPSAHDYIDRPSYAEKKNANNTWDITYTCKIGNKTYGTLNDAVAAVPANGSETTITMVNDFATTEKVTIAAAKNVVLDLNGKKISYTTDGYGSFIENRGQLKIKDSGSTGIITAKFSAPNWSDGCYTINNAGTYENASKLVIESGTIENTSPASGLAWPISNGVWGTYADLVINGGTIHSTNYVPVREYLQYGGKKTVVINGGKLISDNSRAIAVQLNDATVADQGSYVEINGGEFSCNGSGILYIDLHAANVNMAGFTMTVNGGQFKNSNADAPVLVYDDEGNTQTSAVLLSNILKGGIYSKEPAPELIPFGYHIEENTDAQTSSAYPWRVAANPATNAEVSVSKPGQTTVYSTLAAFRDETNAGNTFAGYTVTLLKDIDLTNDDWTPIGTTDYNYYFSGVFDGNNHLITLSKSEIPGDFGFFNLLVGDSEATPAIVENLNLKVNLSSKQSTRTWIGGVTDMAYGYVLFENIVVTGSITSGGYAGGIVGYSSQNDSDWGSKVIYKNCTNKANINIVGKGDYTCLGGIAAQTGSNLDCFINCKNEGILTSDHTNISTAASYMGHMVGKGTYGKNISFSGCSFSESATINGWNVYNSEVSSYPFEGYMTPSQTYTYGTGTPNLGKQMVGGYFGTCTLDGVQQSFTYPNGSSD